MALISVWALACVVITILALSYLGGSAVVTNGADTGPGSLRNTIGSALPSDVITFTGILSSRLDSEFYPSTNNAASRTGSGSLVVFLSSPIAVSVVGLTIRGPVTITCSSNVCLSIQGLRYSQVERCRGATSSSVKKELTVQQKSKKLRQLLFRT